MDTTNNTVPVQPTTNNTVPAQPATTTTVTTTPTPSVAVEPNVDVAVDIVQNQLNDYKAKLMEANKLIAELKVKVDNLEIELQKANSIIDASSAPAETAVAVAPEALVDVDDVYAEIAKQTVDELKGE